MEEKKLKEMIKNLPDEIKDQLILLLLTHDKEDIWIQQIPVYEDITHEGHIVFRYIKEFKYEVGVKHFAKDDVDVIDKKWPHQIYL